MNKLAEANLPLLVAELLTHFAKHPNRGAAITRTVVAEVVAAVADGAGTTDRFAAVSAVFVGTVAARAGYAQLVAALTAELGRKLQAACGAG